MMSQGLLSETENVQPIVEEEGMTELQPEFDLSPLPDAERYPTNIQSTSTETLVKRDWGESRHYLIVTGFSSLEYLIDFFSSMKNDDPRQVRIVLGNEPIFHEELKKKTLRTVPLEEEISEYWLARNISIR